MFETTTLILLINFRSSHLKRNKFNIENLANYGITIANKSIIIEDKHNETNQKLLQ